MVVIPPSRRRTGKRVSLTGGLAPATASPTWGRSKRRLPPMGALETTLATDYRQAAKLQGSASGGLSFRVHRTGQYENNRAEASHQPTRQRERQMRRFKSIEHTHRFLSVHGPVQNLFRVGRHQLKSHHHRLLRDQAFSNWREMTWTC